VQPLHLEGERERGREGREGERERGRDGEREREREREVSLTIKKRLKVGKYNALSGNTASEREVY